MTETQKKETISDLFVKDPNKAMEFGYKPEFKAVGCFLFKEILDFKGIYARIFSIIFGVYYSGNILSILFHFLLNIVRFFITFILSLTYLPLFPIWWCIFYFIFQVDFKRQQKINEKLDKLL